MAWTSLEYSLLMSKICRGKYERYTSTSLLIFFLFDSTAKRAEEEMICETVILYLCDHVMMWRKCDLTKYICQCVELLDGFKRCTGHITPHSVYVELKNVVN